MKPGPEGLRLPRWSHDASAVSEVVGNILLVAITVVVTVILSGIILTRPPPLDQTAPDLVIAVNAGPDRSWNTADENVSIAHRGGESLSPEKTRIIVRGTTPEITYTAATLQSAFATGTGFRIGETWYSTAQPFTLAQNALVSVSVVIQYDGGARVVASASITAGAS